MNNKYMNQKGFANTILVVVIVVLVGAVGYFALVKKSEPVAQQPSLTPTQVSNTTTPNPSQTPTTAQGQVYENQYMRIAIPSGWVARQANKTVYYGNCVNKENCTTTPKVEPNPVAVSITKGNYILYINTKAGQASGIVGGRLGEISSGAPSADAVIVDQQNVPCGISETYPAYTGHSRIDLYVNTQNKQSWCAAPSNGSTVWYFSYITDSRMGYFMYYGDGGPTGLVITMAYNSKDLTKLPIKGSASLNTMLSEMTAIAKTLELK